MTWKKSRQSRMVKITLIMRNLFFIILTLGMVSCWSVRKIFIKHYYATNPSFRELSDNQRKYYLKNNTDTFLLFRLVFGNCFGGSIAGEAKFFSIKNNIQTCQVFTKQPSKRKTKSTIKNNCDLISIIEYFQKSKLQKDVPQFLR